MKEQKEGQPFLAGQSKAGDQQQTSGNEDARNGKRDEETPIYVSGDATLQTPEEHRHDQETDPRKDNTMAASKDDLHTTNADRVVGSDRTDLDGRVI